MYFIAHHILVDIEIVVIFARRIVTYCTVYYIITTVVLRLVSRRTEEMSGHGVETRPMFI